MIEYNIFPREALLFMTTTIRLSFLLTMLCFASCETQRHYFDGEGNEIAPPDDSPKSSSLEERFTSTFTMKKNEEGVPVATSNKVSAFQSKLQSARTDESSSFERKDYEGVREFEGAGLRDAWGEKRVDRREFAGQDKEAYSREMQPDFLKNGSGIISRRDADYSASRSEYEGDFREMDRFSDEGKTGQYAQGDRSQYFDERQQNTPEIKVVSRDEYLRMTIEESRTMMGRDSDDE